MQLDEDMLCDGCGQPRDESMAPEAEGRYRVPKIVCHGCAELAKTQRDLQEDTAEPGIHLIVERNAPSREGEA